MIKGKRGAIELSITTIVVVVIGVTLLALGLAWVSGIFEKLQSTTSGAFEKADAEIGNIFTGGSESDPFRISPTRTTIKQGERNKAIIVLSNGGADVNNIIITTTTDSATSGKVACLMGDTLTTTSKSPGYNLKSGQEAKLTVFIDVKRDTPIGSYSCSFTINQQLGNTPAGVPITLVIDVKK